MFELTYLNIQPSRRLAIKAIAQTELDQFAKAFSKYETQRNPLMSALQAMSRC